MALHRCTWVHVKTWIQQLLTHMLLSFWGVWQVYTADEDTTYKTHALLTLSPVQKTDTAGHKSPWALTELSLHKFDYTAAYVRIDGWQHHSVKKHEQIGLRRGPFCKSPPTKGFDSPHISTAHYCLHQWWKNQWQSGDSNLWLVTFEQKTSLPLQSDCISLINRQCTSVSIAASPCKGEALLLRDTYTQQGLLHCGSWIDFNFRECSRVLPGAHVSQLRHIFLLHSLFCTYHWSLAGDIRSTLHTQGP